MSTWDKIIPHRLLVNHSLRKASEELHSRIDDYQLEYNREIERCTVEIEQAEADKERDFEIVKSSLTDELIQDGDFFDSVQTGLLEYVDLYFQRQYLNKIREIKTLEKQTLVEYGNFLTEQMKLIGEEIIILEARKDKLVLQAKVDDVIELIGLSGCELAIVSNDDALTLLAKVSELLDACDSIERLTKYSLLRLRVILQERVDFLPIIQYISWTIQQKKQLSRQISLERRKITSARNNKIDELRQVSENIDTLNQSLEEQARVVRDYWTIPLTQLNVQISFMYVRLNGIFEELKETNERIQKMKNEHSDDSSTWERLWRDKKNLKEEIPQVKTEIESLKSKRQEWYNRQQMVFALCKRNNVYLISDNNSQESDECRIINKRLTELYRNEEAKLAEQRFNKESAYIQKQKKEKVTEITAQIESVKKKSAEKLEIFNQASLQLSNSKKRDSRFFLSKLISDTDEVSRAKQALQVADAQKQNTDNHLSKLKVELAKVISDFDRRVESCRPTPYKPSTKEKEEIQKLESRKTELLSKQGKSNQRKERYYDNKN